MNTLLKKSLTIATASALAISAIAQSFAPQYVTKAGYGNASSPAEVDLLSEPGAQFRLVSVNYASDTNNAILSVSTGGTAYNITATNSASSSVTNLVNSTNGLSVGATLWLEHGSAVYLGTVSTWNQSTNTGTTSGGAITGGTNVVLTGGGFGVSTSVGDAVYLMTAPVTLPIGAATNWLNGEAIFIGNASRPVRVQLAPALNTNRLYSVTGRYE